jgi:hypothetical protein
MDRAIDDPKNNRRESQHWESEGHWKVALLMRLVAVSYRYRKF